VKFALYSFHHLKGISTDDVPEVPTAILGEDTSVSLASFIRLKKRGLSRSLQPAAGDDIPGFW